MMLHASAASTPVCATVPSGRGLPASVRVPHSFSLVTSHRGYLVQTASDRDLHDWLYAINPLLAGQIRSKTARTSQAARPEEQRTPQSNGQD